MSFVYLLKLRLYCQMVGDKTMFYDKYCELCRQKGISPSAAAIEMGINKGTVSIWKSKGTTPQTAILGKIADYFGVSVDYLLGNEPKEKMPTAKNGSERPKTKLRSISRLEDSEITPEQDMEISNYIDYLLSKRGKE